MADITRRGTTLADKLVSLEKIKNNTVPTADHFCGLVVRVPGYRCRGPCLCSDASGTSEK
jgi:hypothetical protein